MKFLAWLNKKPMDDYDPGPSTDSQFTVIPLPPQVTVFTVAGIALVFFTLGWFAMAMVSA